MEAQGVSGSTARPDPKPWPPKPSSLWHPQNRIRGSNHKHDVISQAGKGRLGKVGRVVKGGILGEEQGGTYRGSRKAGEGGDFQVTSSCGTAETRVLVQDRSTREEAGGQVGGVAMPSTEGSAFRQRGKQAGISAPSGSSPNPQTLARRKPGGVTPAENQGAIHSRCLQNLGPQQSACFRSNTSHSPSKETRPRTPPPNQPSPPTRELGRLLTHLTLSYHLRRGSQVITRPPWSAAVQLLHFYQFPSKRRGTC